MYRAPIACRALTALGSSFHAKETYLPNQCGEQRGQREGEEKHEQEWFGWNMGTGAWFQEGPEQRSMEAETPRHMHAFWVKAGLIARPHHFSFPFFGCATAILLPPFRAWTRPSEDWGCQEWGSQQAGDSRACAGQLALLQASTLCPRGCD